MIKAAEFTEVVMAETVVDEVLADQFSWLNGKGWVLRGRRSPKGYVLPVPEVQVIETVRSYLAAQRGIPAELLNRKYIVNIVALARGILWVRDA